MPALVRGPRRGTRRGSGCGYANSPRRVPRLGPLHGSDVRCENQCWRPSRHAAPARGDLWSDEKRRPGVGARSALRELTRRVSSTTASEASRGSYAARPQAEHRSGVGATRRPLHHESLAGAACREALKRRQSRRSPTAAMGCMVRYVSVRTNGGWCQTNGAASPSTSSTFCVAGLASMRSRKGPVCASVRAGRCMPRVQRQSMKA